VKSLEYLGINDYQILDPAHHEIPKFFPVVLYIGELSQERHKKLSEVSEKAWVLPVPNPLASLVEKKVWIESLKSINEWILTNRDINVFKKLDAPAPMQLEEYLNSLTGRVVALILPDRRKLGIYPDGQRLENAYDIEYHASTIVNIAKLFSLFDASEIVIKEL